MHTCIMHNALSPVVCDACWHKRGCDEGSRKIRHPGPRVLFVDDESSSTRGPGVNSIDFGPGS